MSSRRNLGKGSTWLFTLSAVVSSPALDFSELVQSTRVMPTGGEIFGFDEPIAIGFEGGAVALYRSFVGAVGDGLVVTGDQYEGQKSECHNTSGGWFSVNIAVFFMYHYTAFWM